MLKIAAELVRRVFLIKDDLRPTLNQPETITLIHALALKYEGFEDLNNIVMSVFYHLWECE